MPIYNLSEYNDHNLKTSKKLWQYYRDQWDSTTRDSGSFKSKTRVTGSTPAAGNTKDVEIAVPL